MPLISENMQGAYAGLNDAFQQILRRNGEDELVRLLVDMLEAGDIKLCAEGSGDDIQRWMADKDSRFATRFLAIENKLWAAIAHLFLTGQIIFGVDTDPFNVRWYTRRLPVN